MPFADKAYVTQISMHVTPTPTRPISTHWWNPEHGAWPRKARGRRRGKETTKSKASVS